jgi:dipeptidase D
LVKGLESLGEPSEFWEYFKAITRIPRCSGNEGQIRSFIKDEAENFGFNTMVDNVGNLMVRIPPKGAKVVPNKVILQCHIDMVCEKNTGISHDFSKDPIKLEISERDGEKWLTAQGTTLGADNGVGIAFLLTLMKKIRTDELFLGPIEMLFTVDEESGLVGAFNIEPGLVEGIYLINLDSEEDDTFTIGCAGGINTIATLSKIETTNLFYSHWKENSILARLTVEGLTGGHSGVDIHLNRGNALKIMGKILNRLNTIRYEIELVSINGGNKSNAIPREANCIFLVDMKKDVDIFLDFKDIKSGLEKEYITKESNIKLSFEFLEDYKIQKRISNYFKEKIIHLLNSIPTGPKTYHPEDQRLVHTSSNLASIKTEKETITIVTSQRSLEESSKKDYYELIARMCRIIEPSIDIQHIGDYPGWPPDWDSNLVKISKQTYSELFDEEPEIQVIHAGLECGILKKHFPDMEMISIGPTIEGPHSPDERLKIKSVEKIWNFLLKLLEKIT